MEKVKRLVILILFFVLGITMVNAQNDIFEYAWSKDIIDIDTETGNLEDLLGNQKKGYGTGYVITKLKKNEDSVDSTLEYFNNKGELLKSKSFANKIVESLNVKDDYIYVLFSDETSSDTKSYILMVLNDNLDVIGEQVLTSDEVLLANIGSLTKFVGVDIISTENNEVTIVGINEEDVYMTHYDKELKNKTTELLLKHSELPDDLPEEEITNIIIDTVKKAGKYYPIAEEYINMYENVINTGETPENMEILFDQKGSKRVYSGANITQCESFVKTVGHAAPEPCHLSSVIKLTNDNQVIFEKNHDEYAFLVNAKIIDNYIVAIGLKNVEDLTKLQNYDDINNLQSDVVILNMNGEIVGTISKEKSKYIEITPSAAGFAVNKVDIVCEEQEVPPRKEANPVICSIKSSTEAYNLPREVITKITGKGNISVANTSIAGDNVTYVITPEKGYVLGKVIITDENGNVIETTNNTFTMPSAAVTIEVEFLPENPETRDIAVIAFGIVLLLGTILTLVNYKRLKTIR